MTDPIGSEPLRHPLGRRRFMAAIAGGLVAVPLAARAQPKSKQPTIGLIFSNTPLADVLGPQPKLRDTRAFLDGMRNLGWVDGQNITIERRSVEGQPDRFPALVQEMLALHVELVVTSWGNAPKIVTEASDSLPLVMVGGTADFLIREGYVTSLARPGRTVTGLASSTGAENADKMLQLLKEGAPRISRVAHLYSPPFRPNTVEAAARARALNLTLLPVEVASPEGFEKAFTTIRRSRVDAIFVGGSPFFLTHQREISEFAASERLPAVYWNRSFVEVGGLVSFGTDWSDLYRRAAGYADKILKGAKPGDLPIEQPTKFELVINLKTAKALGLTIPPSLLARADQVIE